ncbi:hypothetical protein [Halioglobus sp. Uisw_031]|uniref:hypothetical protein n=1 Tax=Halioglobus sp. Uisw_031 TaxID=3230977 RepID=UPI0039E853DB
MTVLDGLEQLGPKLGQQLLIQGVDLSNRTESVVEIGYQLPGEGVDRLRHIAHHLSADIVVCANEGDVEQLEDLVNEGVEVCQLDSYLESVAEQDRDNWRSPQRLDDQPKEEVLNVLARLVKYAPELIVIDRMVAKWANEKPEPTRRLKEWAYGIVMLMELWNQHSPKAGKLDAKLVILTEGGSPGGRGGAINAQRVVKNLKKALGQADRKNILDDIVVDLRRDSIPSVLQDRWIRSGLRCWQVSHETEALADVEKPIGSRKILMINPDSSGGRGIVDQVFRLKRIELPA